MVIVKLFSGSAQDAAALVTLVYELLNPCWDLPSLGCVNLVSRKACHPKVLVDRAEHESEDAPGTDELVHIVPE